MRQLTLDTPVRASCVARPECLASLLTMLDCYCERMHIDHLYRHDLHLMAEEACINVINHAYPTGHAGPLSLQVLTAARDGRPSVEITVEDRGVPFDPLALPVPDRNRPLDELPPGGLGVLLMRRLSDLQHYLHDPDRGNVLTLTKFLEPRS